MTCIVGLVENGIIYMGSDSASTDMHNQVTVCSFDKVFIVDNFLFGFTISYRMGQIIKYYFHPPIHKKNIDDYQYMATDFIEAIKECFLHNDFHIDEDVLKHVASLFLVGYRGKLFVITSDFGIEESVDNYLSVGCAQGIVMGALYAVKDFDVPPENKILKALEASARYQSWVCPPFIIKKLE